MKNFIFILCSFLIVSNAFCQEIVDSSTVIAEQIIYFDSDKFNLVAEHQDSINVLIEISHAHDSLLWVVKAHTDQVGSFEYNEMLSKKREDAAVDYLLDNGIQKSLINSFSYGENLPESNVDDKLNRRAFIQLVVPKKYLYLNGQVVDKETKTGISAKVEVDNEDYKNETYTDSFGTFSILVPYQEMVNVAISSEGYFFETNQISVTEKLLDRSITVKLPSIEIGKKYLFRNILFYGNRSEILPDSEWNIFYLQRFMETNDELCIEIHGHINLPNQGRVPRASSHFELSVARAYEVKSKLIAAGISEDRIRTKGNGNWDMKYPSAETLELQKQNRRVEIKVLDCNTILSIADDSLEDHKRYKYELLDRSFSEKCFPFEKIYFNKSVKLQITTQVELMKTKQIDPSDFTYKQILIAYPEIPKKATE